ncbi:MAG: MFS transporter [Bacteriovoracaceae bacterium]
MSLESKSSPDPYIALKYPSFRLFIAFKFFITVALQVESVLAGWQIYDFTHDALSLGLMGLAEVIPNISVTLFGGHLADRINRKYIMLTCLVVLFVDAVGLSFFSRQLGVPYLYASIAVTGLCRGFIGPASFGLMSETVPREHYVNSSAWSSSLWQIAAMLGAGSAGFLLHLLGYSHCYDLSALLIFIATFAIFLIKYDFKPPTNKRDSVFVSIKEGLAFVWADGRIVGAMGLDMLAVLFGGATALLPIFANEILKVGPEGLGLLRAAPSLGALLMAIFLTRFPPVKKSGKKLFISVAVFGLCMIGFAISTNFYLSLVFLFISGAIDNVSVVIRSTIMQTLTPHHMKGRVSSVNSIFISSSNEIGAFESGVAAKVMGTIPSVVFGGMMTLVVVIMMYFLLPKLKELEFKDAL